MNDIKTLILKYVCYTLVLLLVSYLFESFSFDSNWWVLLASFVVFILNVTIKPIIVWLTLPITGVTYGIFYFVINLIILKVTDWILLSHFDIKGIIAPFFIAIFISIINMLMEMFIVIPIKERCK